MFTAGCKTCWNGSWRPERNGKGTDRTQSGWVALNTMIAQACGMTTGSHTAPPERD